MIEPTALSSNLFGIMLRICTVFMLCLLTCTSQAAQGNLREMDLVGLQLSHLDSRQFSAYQLDTTLANTPTSSFVFNKTLRLPSISDIKKSILWTTSIRWHYTDDGIRSSLSPRLLLESRQSRIEINPLKHSASYSWRKELR